MDINSIRSLFPITTKCTYLNHADVGPIPASVQTAMAEQGRLHMEYIGSARNKVQDRYRAGRFLAAQLVEGSADRVSYIQNSADGLSIVINGIDWQEGDNLIIPAKAFPTNYHPWMKLKQRGVEVRLIELHNGCLTPDALKPLIDERTRLVSISQVQFFNGFRVDLASFSEICHAHDALLVVDGTQAVGGMTLDMWSSGTDVLIVSAHKWILGPWGIGFMVFSDRAFEALEVSHIGLKSLRNP
ncbi:MAG: aminotransferase class V-fold PLP-dependent enzyme, partial [Chloroflexota bacterium]